VCPYCETTIEHDPAATPLLTEAKRPPRRRQSR
jgi:hypothetical protein